jgi:transposase
MNLYHYETIVKSESSARKYVVGFCFKNHHRFCPACKGRKLYRLGDGRRRCARCRKTFHDFTDRWLNDVQLSCGQWLRIIKLFELELSTRKIAQQLSLSYNTTYKAITILRFAILAHARDGHHLLGGEVELDEAYLGGKREGKRERGAAHKIPVFGILERDGEVFVETVPNIKAETVLDLTINKVRRGSLVYTDKYRIYDTLMFCGYRHLRVDHQHHFAKGRVYINGLEGFCSYAKERLHKHHGISPERFPLYIKELA